MNIKKQISKYKFIIAVCSLLAAIIMIGIAMLYIPLKDISINLLINLSATLIFASITIILIDSLILLEKQSVIKSASSIASDSIEDLLNDIDIALSDIFGFDIVTSLQRYNEDISLGTMDILKIIKKDRQKFLSKLISSSDRKVADINKLLPFEIKINQALKELDSNLMILNFALTDSEKSKLITIRSELKVLINLFPVFKKISSLQDIDFTNILKPNIERLVKIERVSFPDNYIH